MARDGDGPDKKQEQTTLDIRTAYVSVQCKKQFLKPFSNPKSF